MSRHVPGRSSSPSICQRERFKHLDKNGGNLYCGSGESIYLDDALATGKTDTGHLRIVQMVLQHSGTLHSKECQFATPRSVVQGSAATLQKCCKMLLAFASPTITPVIKITRSQKKKALAVFRL